MEEEEVCGEDGGAPCGSVFVDTGTETGPTERAGDRSAGTFLASTSIQLHLSQHIAQRCSNRARRVYRNMYHKSYRCCSGDGGMERARGECRDRCGALMRRAEPKHMRDMNKVLCFTLPLLLLLLWFRCLGIMVSDDSHWVGQAHLLIGRLLGLFQCLLLFLAQFLLFA